jgi:hypothetical protein
MRRSHRRQEHGDCRGSPCCHQRSELVQASGVCRHVTRDEEDLVALGQGYPWETRSSEFEHPSSQAGFDHRDHGRLKRMNHVRCYPGQRGSVHQPALLAVSGYSLYLEDCDLPEVVCVHFPQLVQLVLEDHSGRP